MAGVPALGAAQGVVTIRLSHVVARQTPKGLALERFGDYTWMWYADMVLALIAAAANLPIRETSPKAVPAAA